MKEKIEEMAKVLDACPFLEASIGADKHEGSMQLAAWLAYEGFRKQSEVAMEIFERLHAHRKFDGHTLSVWSDDLVCVAKEFGIDLEQYDALRKKTEV